MFIRHNDGKPSGSETGASVCWVGLQIWKVFDFTPEAEAGGLIFGFSLEGQPTWDDEPLTPYFNKPLVIQPEVSMSLFPY